MSETERKNSFVLYGNWGSAINVMTDEQAGKLFKAIFAIHYQTPCKITDPVLLPIYEIIREKMQDDRKKYEEKCRINAENAKNKKQATESGRDQTEATESGRKKNKAKRNTRTRYDNDTGNDNDTEKNNNPPSPFSPSKVDVLNYFVGCGTSEAMAISFFEYFQSKGWKTKSGADIKDWQFQAQLWIQTGGKI